MLAFPLLQARVSAAPVALIRDHACGHPTFCVFVNVADSSCGRRAHLVTEHRELLLIARVGLQVFVAAAARLRQITLLPFAALAFSRATVSAALVLSVVAVGTRIFFSCTLASA